MNHDDTSPRGAAWRALEDHHATIASAHLRELFDDDPDRGTRLTCEAEGLYLDYSKNRVTDETMALLMDVARTAGLAQRRERMFRGEHINVSEDRAVLHVALRMPKGSSLVVDGVDVVKQVQQISGGAGVRYAVEAAGSSVAMLQAVQSVGPAAVALLLGIAPGAQMTLDVTAIQRNNTIDWA